MQVWRRAVTSAWYGSGATPATICEDIEAELHVLNGRATWRALIGMNKLHDSIDIEWLRVAARELEFPKKTYC